MAHAGSTDGAARASELAAGGDWTGAFELLMGLDAESALDPLDLPLLAQVAYAAGHLDVTIAAWERVHATGMEMGDPVGAAGAAARVAMHLLFDAALMAPVRGWLRRAERLLDGEPDSPAHAWTAVVRTYERLLSGDSDGARHSAARAVAVGSTCEPAAAAIGQVATARLLVLGGDVDAGLTMLEEVGVATTSGDLDPLATGVVYCELVCALQGLAQYDLAEEWTEVMERWCTTNAIGSLHGRCRVHRAEILRLRGSCGEAEDEATAACEELRPYLRRELGWPLTELGRGDLAGAEEALLAAHRIGWDPQPGLAIVHLADGNIDAATEEIRDALARPQPIPSKEHPPNDSLRRAPLLAAQVEIELAAGEVDRASAAAEELGRIADRFGSSALVGHAEIARGRVRLAEGRSEEAHAHLSEAARIWRDVGAPYELALARRGIGEAHLALGRSHQAELELEAARALLDEVAGAPGEPTSVILPGPRSGEPNRLVREGDHWAFSFAGRTVRVRDLIGIHHLAHLLAEPCREFHVLDLVSLERGHDAESERRLGQTGGPPSDDGAGAMLDDQARTAYRRRLAEIDEDIEDARATGDIGRAAQSEAEREFLVRELSRAFGLGGRRRRAGAASERARVAVTRTLRKAIEQVAEHHEPLGDHLRHAVRTGTYCSYEPDPAAPVTWLR